MPPNGSSLGGAVVLAGAPAGASPAGAESRPLKKSEIAPAQFGRPAVVAFFILPLAGAQRSLDIQF